MTESREIYKALERWAFGWIPFWTATAVIVRGAVMPPKDIPQFLFEVNDKLIHGAEFFVMMLIAYHAFERALSEKIHRYRFSDAILYSLFLGALTECLQFYTPGRSPDIFDFFADSVGVAAAALIMGKITKIQDTRNK
ncbi:MAG: VanZ family protein [Candidatus Omnitrophica bacterium]|nr:VanZ family protein [Candidatus Omnitrophota bacterium]